MMKKNITIFSLLLGSVLLPMSKEASADAIVCSIKYPAEMFLYKDLVVPESLAVGSLILETFILPRTVFDLCYSYSSDWHDLFIKTDQKYLTTINGRRVYEIPGLDGIGYAVGVKDEFPCNGNDTYWIGTTSTKYGSNSAISCASSKVFRMASATYKVAFYKTGEKVSAGSFNRFKAAEINMGTYYKGSTTTMPFGAPFYISGFGIKPPACSVSNSVINVKLPPAKVTDFSGVGSSSSTTAFNIGLDNCDAGLKVKMTLSPGSSGSTGKDIGLLTADSTSNTRGLALQLMYNNAPVKLDSAFEVLSSETAQGGTVSGAQYQIPLAVRYYLSTPDIKGGKINATATFTMTYN